MVGFGFTDKKLLCQVTRACKRVEYLPALDACCKPIENRYCCASGKKCLNGNCIVADAYESCLSNVD